jgi:hypothetical protein
MLDEIELIAAADEEATHDVMAHLQACSFCARRAREIVELQNLLRKRLYRVFCPTSDELAAYYQGLTDEAPRKQVAIHLAECAQCSAELELLAAASRTPFAELEAPPALGRPIIAERIAPTPSISFATYYQDDRQQVYQAGTLRIVLNIEQELGSSKYALLRGVITGHPRRGITASLLYQGQVISSAPFNEKGEFVIDDVSPGNFVLSLRLPDYEVIVEALHIY